MFRSFSDTYRTPVAEMKSDLNSFNCDMCQDGGWMTEADVDIHRRKQHKAKILNLMRGKKYICTICYRQQRSKSSLLYHIKTRHLLTPANSKRIQRETFFCDHCKHLFYNKTLLSAHIHSTHMLDKKNRKGKGKKMMVECPECHRYLQACSLWYHYLHHGILTPSACPVCLKYFDDTDQMVEHSKSHPGYYFCDMCCYQTNKEQYFNNHIEKHKKNSSKDDSVDISKYFIPGNYDIVNNINLLKQYKGIQMSPALQICVLCREMCTCEEEMRRHILGDHAPEREDIPKTHRCACGEVFFNGVLLKQHVFKLKEQHRVLGDDEAPNDSNLLIDSEDLEITGDQGGLDEEGNEITYQVIQTLDVECK